jgi:triosephosphate isomerase (TIM)
MRRPVIAGNWKMNPPSREEALALAGAVAEAAGDAPGVTTVICPPTIWLADVSRAVGSEVAVGAQTMHFEERGAYTGETSPLMLAGLATFVILGHSERRQFDGETDAGVGRKVAAAVRHGLRPIAAVGERAEERRAGETAGVIDRQVRAALDGLERIGGSGLVIAYEPVWAIGTGRTATPEQAQAVHAFLRGKVPAQTPILYGGSVKPQNAAAIFAMPDVDGGLIGGASLVAKDFLDIVKAAQT